MSKSSIVVWRNNGVKAVVLEADYHLLKRSANPEEALGLGVRWYVFMSYKRLLRQSKTFQGAAISTFNDYQQVIESLHTYRIREQPFYVPLSNGPLYYPEEFKFVFTVTDLWQRLENNR